MPAIGVALNSSAPNFAARISPGFPELSEPQVLRHFLRLSQLNFAQALEFYPLGSCTMKYNPVVNDELAALPGLAGLHPCMPAHLAQGALELIARMEAALAEITGMDAVSLHPAAGAQGELTGLLMVRAYHRKRGEMRHKVIIPDTAHGTNPASCTLAGFEVIVAKSNKRGYLEAAEVRRLVSDDVAAMMVTNPNTLGIFEPEIQEIAAALHERGAMLYLDGANMNALLGVAKPGHMGADIVQLNLHKSFSTPHGGGGPGAGPVAVKKHLEPFLPLPRLKHSDCRLRNRRRSPRLDRPDALVSQQLRNDRARVRVHPRARRRRPRDGEPARDSRRELRAQAAATAFPERDRRALDA